MQQEPQGQISEVSSLLDDSVESLKRVDELLTQQRLQQERLLKELAASKNDSEALKLELIVSWEESKKLRDLQTLLIQQVGTYKERFARLLSISRELERSLEVSIWVNRVAVPVAVAAVGVIVVMAVTNGK